MNGLTQRLWRSGASWSVVVIFAALALWRLSVTLQTDSDDFGGVAERQYRGLLFLQTVCLAAAGLCWRIATSAPPEARSRAQRLVAAVLCALFAVAAAVIQTKHGLTGWGGYEK